MLWMSTRGSAVLQGDVAMRHGSLANGVPNQVDIHPAPNGRLAEEGGLRSHSLPSPLLSVFQQPA